VVGKHEPSLRYMIHPFHLLEANEESDTWWGSLVWILVLAAIITISDDLFFPFSLAWTYYRELVNIVAVVLRMTNLSSQTSHNGVY
jgi:hypothetical protein